jgi:hypothetical protein
MMLPTLMTTDPYTPIIPTPPSRCSPTTIITISTVPRSRSSPSALSTYTPRTARLKSPTYPAHLQTTTDGRSISAPPTTPTGSWTMTPSLLPLFPTTNSHSCTCSTVTRSHHGTRPRPLPRHRSPILQRPHRYPPPPPQHPSNLNKRLQPRPSHPICLYLPH